MKRCSGKEFIWVSGLVLVLACTANGLSALSNSFVLTINPGRKAFSPRPRRLSIGGCGNSLSSWKALCYLQSRSQDEDEEEPEAAVVPNPEKHTPEVSEDEKPKIIMQNILLQINFGFAYIMITLGALLTIGLVLNVFGYGYQITPEGQLRIDTLNVLREEAQFRREVYTSMKEYQQEQKTLLEKSSAPR